MEVDFKILVYILWNIIGIALMIKSYYTLDINYFICGLISFCLAELTDISNKLKEKE